MAGKTDGLIKLRELLDKEGNFTVVQTDLIDFLFGRRALFYKKGELVKQKKRRDSARN